MTLRPIDPLHAARAIGRFLEQCSAGEEGAFDRSLSGDVQQQLTTMQSTLEGAGRRGRSKRDTASRRSVLPISVVDGGEVTGGTGGAGSSGVTGSSKKARKG